MAKKIDPQRYDARRQQIVSAAIPLFATNGFQGTTTAQICRAAGMSSGNVFHYFGSKQEIFEATFLDNQGEVAESLRTARQASDPWEGFLGFVDHLTEGALVPHVPGLVLEMMMHASRNPGFAVRLSEQEQTEEEAAGELLTVLAQAGQIDPGLDIPRAASWVIALVGALYLRAATTEHFDPREQVATLRLILTRFLRPGEPGGGAEQT